MTNRRIWALRLADPLATRNGDTPLDLCSSYSQSADVLAQSWDVRTRDELISTLEWLRNEGHRYAFQEQQGSQNKHDFLAWDLVRLAQLTRWGVRAGLLDVETAWRWLDQAGELAGQAYGSWGDYLDDYAAGFRAWSDSPEDADHVSLVTGKVKSLKLPPWNPPHDHLNPLVYRWRNLCLKTSLGNRLRLVLVTALIVGATIAFPIPYGAASALGLLLVLATKSLLGGASAKKWLNLLALALFATSLAGGAFIDKLPRDQKDLAVAGLFFMLTLYISAYAAVFSDDRTPGS